MGIFDSLIQGMTKGRAGKRHISRDPFSTDDVLGRNESSYELTVDNVQNGQVVAIVFRKSDGEVRRYRRLCLENEDVFDHMKQLVALAKLEM